MVTSMPKPPARRGPGRPKKYSQPLPLYTFRLPAELRAAVEVYQHQRMLGDLGDAVRDLLREGVESWGLLKGRKC